MSTIVLLHGALATERQMTPLAGMLPGHQVFTLTFSGHGARVAEPLSFERFVQDIEAVVARSQAERVHLFGYSMGGYAALLYAARHPDRVLSVTTLGTMLVWSEEILHKELRKLDPDAMEAKVPAFTRSLADQHGTDHWRGVVTRVAESMAELAAFPLLTGPVITRIQCPVLVCVGEGDTSAGVENTRAFATRLRNAAFKMLPGTRHPFEEVDLVALVSDLSQFWTLSEGQGGPGKQS